MLVAVRREGRPHALLLQWPALGSLLDGLEEDVTTKHMKKLRYQRRPLTKRQIKKAFVRECIGWMEDALEELKRYDQRKRIEAMDQRLLAFTIKPQWFNSRSS